MNNALDKYLTTEPDNGWDAYFEAVCDGLPDSTFSWDEARNHAPTESDKFTALIEAMFNAGVNPGDAVNIIEKAFSFFDNFPVEGPPKRPFSRMKDFFYMTDPTAQPGMGKSATATLTPDCKTPPPSQ